VWLDVGVLGPEQLLRALDGQRLDVVGEGDALVVTPPGYPSAYLALRCEASAWSTAGEA
jgi:hypothetical protein